MRKGRTSKTDLRKMAEDSQTKKMNRTSVESVSRLLELDSVRRRTS